MPRPELENKEKQRQFIAEMDKFFGEATSKFYISKTKEVLADNNDFTKTFITEVLDDPDILIRGMFFRTKGKNYCFGLDTDSVRLSEWKRQKQIEGFTIHLHKEITDNSYLYYHCRDGSEYSDNQVAENKIKEFLKQI